jgi:hypothetical protein
VPALHEPVRPGQIFRLVFDCFLHQSQYIINNFG